MTRSKALLSVSALVALVATAWLALVGVGVTRRVAPATIQHETGRAYVVPVGSRWPLRPIGDSMADPNRSGLLVLENGVAMGPGHALHDAIRQAGAGRFSHWESVVYFSTSDGTDPRTNGRAYELRFVAFLDGRLAVAAMVLSTSAFILSIAMSGMAARVRAANDARTAPRVLQFLGRLLARVALAVLSIALVLAVAEAVARRSRPFLVSSMPALFDARVGFLYQPNTIVRWTNHVDFWAETRVNSLGFLDRELPTSRPADGCRVLFIGDSFLEAAQVTIDKKFHVLFERLATERFRRPFQTVAFGYSGTGQASQMPFYEVFGKALQPDVVVLVIANNDLANNSPALEAIRAGWHPLFPPRLFYRREEQTGAFSRIPITSDWPKYLLPADPPNPAKPRRMAALHARLFPASALYQWAYTHVSIEYPAFTARLMAPEGPPGDPYRVPVSRMAAIRRIPGYEHVFDGWRYPDDLDYDVMFFARVLPPVFEEAVEITGHVIDEYLRHARADGFALVGLATYGLHREFGATRTLAGREVDDDGYYRRVAALLAARDVPLVDQYEYIKRIGRSPVDAYFQRDGHWSEQGHRWAADALLELFAARPGLCPARRA